MSVTRDHSRKQPGRAGLVRAASRSEPEPAPRGGPQRVADACSDEALAAPVFNASGDQRSGGRFWMSSMLNEAVVHGFDAATAADRATEVDPDIAAALIGNDLTMLTSPTWAMQRPKSAHALRGTGQTLQWLATDATDGTDAWFVERRPDGAGWRPGTGQADVTMSGPAQALLPTLTRRLPLADGPATRSALTATPTSPSTGSTTPPTPATDRHPRPLP